MSTAEKNLLTLIRECVSDFESQHVQAEQAAAGCDPTPPQLRRAAWFAAAAGDSVCADAHLLRARVHARDDGEAWFATGLLCLAKDDQTAARQAFEAAIRARFPAGPDRDRLEAGVQFYDAAADRLAIFRILYHGFDHGFCCFIILRQVTATEEQSYAFCMARALTHLMHTQATAGILEEDLRINGDSMWYRIGLGHLRWIALRRDEADDCYSRAKEFAVTRNLMPYHFDCGVMVWLRRQAAEALPGHNPLRLTGLSTADWRYRCPKPAGAAPALAIVVGCDRGYFDFFPKFLLSAVTAYAEGNHCKGLVVHCHIADPGRGQIDFLESVGERFARDFPDVIVSCSTGPAQFKDGSYYSCLRYLVMLEVMARYGCGTMALDIDSVLDPGFFKHCDFIQGFDLGLRMYNFDRLSQRQVAGEPWSIGAHPTYVANTPIGQRFAAFLRDYVSVAYDPTLSTNWTIDQCAIAQGYDLLIRPAPACKVLNFAYFDTLYHLPEEFGGKAEFLEAGGRVTAANFWPRAAACIGSPPAQA